MTAPDLVTFAWPATGNRALAKVIDVVGERIVAKEPPRHVARLRFVEHPVHDLGSLYLTVRRAAAEGAIAVRGKPKASVGRRAIYDDDQKGPAGLDVVPRRWVAFDWDGLPLELQPCPNPRWQWEPHPLLEPWVGARIALRRLPPAFRNASCFWQVSAGAGFDPGFRLRTWHWLDHPVTGAELKIWLHPAIQGGLVDPATLVEAQPHFLSVRVFGGADPCPRRFGFLRHRLSQVAVPDIEGIKRRQHQRELAQRPPEQRPVPHDPAQAQAWAEHRIDDCLAAIRASASGSRHPTYKTEAARARAYCDRGKLDWQPVRRALVAAYESTLSSAEASRRRTDSIEGVLTWIERRAAP
jgi:hypothetical protein